MEDDALVVAFADPDDQRARDALSSLVQRTILPRVALPNEVAHHIRTHYDRFEKASRRAEADVAPLANAP